MIFKQLAEAELETHIGKFLSWYKLGLLSGLFNFSLKYCTLAKVTEHLALQLLRTHEWLTIISKLLHHQKGRRYICYAYVNSSPLLVRGCVTNRKNVCPNSNAYEMFVRSEASVATTQDTGRVHVLWSKLLLGTIRKITLTHIRCICISMHNTLKDGHPNWSLGISWYDYWYVGITTAYMNSSLWE